MLTIDQIRPGAVAYLDTSILLTDPRLRRVGRGQFRSGPFVCIEIGAGYTKWLSITSQPGPHSARLAIAQAWRGGGSKTWRYGPCYLSDARESFSGRDVLFCDASRGEFDETRIDRPFVTAEGLAAIHDEIAKWKRLTA